MGFIVKAVKAVVKVVGKVIKGGLKLVMGLVRSKGKKNKATDGRLSKSLEPEDFRKIIFGETAMATDLRFWEVHGAKNDNYSEVLAAAGHQVEEFGALYIEDELVPFTGSAATGKFAGVLFRTTNTGAPGNAALAVGAGTYWSSTSKFTGTAHYSLKWIMDEKKLPGGVPSRYTQVGKGARVYDPRRDTTMGGSGTHRANDQTTWAYATLDGNSKPIGRNNALQMLWYLIGWRIQNPSTLEWNLVCGRGVDLNDINWPEWIAAANDAEARSNYTDMILSTGDDHSQNESIISADGLLGELLDPGGLWTYKVIKDDTADITVALGEDDVLDTGDVSWVPEAKLSEKFNEVTGTYVDPVTLYQSKAYTTVKDASYVTLDGYKKRATHGFQGVQDTSLAQKLSRIKLNRTRFTGEFSATFGFRALKAQVWSVVTLTIDRYGFSNKLFRVISQSITPDGIEMLLREENATIYTAGSVTVPTAPSSNPAKYDTTQTVALTTLAGSGFTAAGANSTVEAGVRLSWDALSGNVRRIEIEYKPTAATFWANGGVVGGDKTTIDVTGLLGQTGYSFRARTWTIHEVPSAWQTVTVTTGAVVLDFGGVGGVTRPSDNAGSNFSLVTGGETTKIAAVGNTITQTAALVTGWNAWAYTEQSFTWGAFISAKTSAGSGHDGPMIGLTSPANKNLTNYTSTDYGLHRTPSVMYAIEGTSVYGLGVTGADSDVWSVNYDNVNVRYLKNSTVMRTVAAAAGLVLHGKVSFNALGSGVPTVMSNIQFGPYTDNNFASTGGATKPENNSDVTSAITGVAEIIIQCDHLGVASTGQLTKVTNYKLLRQGTDVTATTTWSRTLLSGTATSTITGGSLSISAITTDAVFRLTGVYGGTTRTLDVKVTRILALPPPPSGSGTTQSGGASGTVNSTTAVVIAGPFTINVGSAGQAQLTASSIGFSTTDASPVGTFGLIAQWQEWNGSAWVGLGTENSETLGAIIALDPEFSFYYHEQLGEITTNYTRTGLTANSTGHQFRLVGRLPSGTRARYPYNSTSATGS